MHWAHGSLTAGTAVIVGFGLLTGIGTEHIGRYTYGKTPSVMAQLEIEYADGTRDVVATDKSWKVTGKGPIQEADLLMGECYDARQELPGWSNAGFDDGDWEAAIAASENGHPQATFYEFQNATAACGKSGNPRAGSRSRVCPAAARGIPRCARARDRRNLAHRSRNRNRARHLQPGPEHRRHIRLEVQGSAGQVITLRYGEMLYPDGRLMTENLRKARATDHYVLTG